MYVKDMIFFHSFSGMRGSRSARAVSLVPPDGFPDLSLSLSLASSRACFRRAFCFSRRARFFFVRASEVGLLVADGPELLVVFQNFLESRREGREIFRLSFESL